MQIVVFGMLEVRHSGRSVGPHALGGRKPKQILEMLAAGRGRPVSKEHLIDQLWGEQTPRHPVAALENHVWMLRSRLRATLPGSPAVVIAEASAYRLDVERCRLDLDQFDALVAQADRLGRPAGRPQLEDALALARGDVFEEEPYAEWADTLRNSYRILVQRVRLDAAEAASLDDDAGAVVTHASAAIEREPLNERACRLLMQGLAMQGERERAVRLFESFRVLLRSELDLEPLPETVAVRERIRAGAWTTQRDSRAVPQALVGGVQPRPAVRAGWTPLIGRVDEVHALTGALECMDDSGFQLVLVEGLAHVGKTRVVREVLPGRSDARVGWARRSVPYPGQPHLPLLWALRAAVGPARVGEPADRTTLEGLEFVGDRIRDLAPIVLVLDDVHHLDGAAAAALSYLQHRCADVAAAVVAVGRAEELTFGHPVRSLQPTSLVRIATLDAAALAGILDEEAVVRTGGYGAYVEAWLAGEREGPPTDADLLDAILERCRAAGSRAYRILLAASVLPEPLCPEAVSAATGITLRSVAEELDRLRSRGILRELADGFGFSCTLVSDALASEVSPARRHVIATSLTEVAVSQP